MYLRNQAQLALLFLGLVFSVTAQNSVDNLNTYIESGDIVSVRKVLESRKVDLNAIGNNGLMPIESAVISDNAAIIDLLVQFGADVNVENPKNKYPPIFVAIARGEYKALEYLLKNGAKVDQINSRFSQTPVDFARVLNDKQTLEIISSTGKSSSTQAKTSDSISLHFNVELASQVVNLEYWGNTNTGLVGKGGWGWTNGDGDIDHPKPLRFLKEGRNYVLDIAGVKKNGYFLFTLFDGRLWYPENSVKRLTINNVDLTRKSIYSKSDGIFWRMFVDSAGEIVVVDNNAN